KAKASVSPRWANVLRLEGCLHPEGEGYLTPSGGEPELDREKSGSAAIGGELTLDILNALLFRSVLKE
ncbi:hypothetical protein, partial [Geobacillus thermoleovorans]|uniref:hypothetical protein n=1 Tax=Geobacillus thermoleovorans TaxID=33941 RepID=UPI0005397191